MKTILVLIALVILWFFNQRKAAPAAKGRRIKAVKSTPQPNNAQQENTIVIGQYNIHRARGQDGEKNLGRIAQVIAQATKEVDIVGLCELQGAPKFMRPNQLKQLAARLKLAGLFCPTQKRWGYYDRGNGLLSRFGIQSWSREPLRDSVGNHARSLCRCDINIFGNISPVFICHLARRADQTHQLKMVFEHFNQHQTAILMGDFNVDGTHPLLQKLIKKSNALDALASVDAPAKGNRIDWILLKGFDLVEAGMQDSIASDHPYYWCRIKLKKA